MARIVVVDYHKGNLSSVARGLDAAGAQAEISDDPERIRSAEALVLPGVGSFVDAIAYLRESGQDQAILDAIGAGKPFLGICLGLQLLFERGSETGFTMGAATLNDSASASSKESSSETREQTSSWIDGLAVLPGDAIRLESSTLKVPHVGWDQVNITQVGKACPILTGVPSGSNMYFTHSYVVCPEEGSSFVAARTDYVSNFASVIWQDNIFGCQFHPEKSSGAGHKILENFCKLTTS